MFRLLVSKFVEANALCVFSMLYWFVRLVYANVRSDEAKAYKLIRSTEQHFEAVFGWLWLALAGSGWLWLALTGSGWLWLALAGFSMFFYGFSCVSMIFYVFL
jgi:hypothetical protein